MIEDKIKKSAKIIGEDRNGRPLWPASRVKIINKTDINCGRVGVVDGLTQDHRLRVQNCIGKDWRWASACDGRDVEEYNE